MLSLLLLGTSIAYVLAIWIGKEPNAVSFIVAASLGDPRVRVYCGAVSFGACIVTTLLLAGFAFGFIQGGQWGAGASLAIGAVGAALSAFGALGILLGLPSGTRLLRRLVNADASTVEKAEMETDQNGTPDDNL